MDLEISVMSFIASSHAGRLHHYAPRLVAFEHHPPRSENTQQEYSHNFILFLGGLGDDLLSVTYPLTLSKLLPPSHSLVEVRLSSSSGGWTTSSLESNADEVAKAVAYFQKLSKSRTGGDEPGKVILIGHSTGSQIALSYLIGNRNRPSSDTNPPSRPAIDGIILQAGISDREVIGAELSAAKVKSSIELSKSMIKDSRGKDQLPAGVTGGLFEGSQPSAERWVSLADEGGDDDLFSSDLSDDVLQRIWGANGGLASRRCPALVLWGEKDEHVPFSISKEAVIRRWGDVVRKAGGVCDEAIVPGAGHNLNKSSDAAVEDLCQRMVNFIQDVEKGDASKRSRF